MQSLRSLRRLLLFPALFTLSLTSDICAATYYVNLKGSDTADGTTSQKAFHSLQKGVDALAPGDTLLIAPGEYAQTAQRTGLGSMDVDTRIRAEIPGTVVVRGDIDAPNFEEVAGHNYIYSIPLDHAPTAVNEIDTLKVFASAPSKGELEFAPGLFYYNAEEKKLYISTSDYRPIETHRYTISVKNSHGINLVEPKRVIVEGLLFRGFNTADRLMWQEDFFTRFGILLRDAKQSVIRDCTAFLNGSGIGMSSGKEGGGNLIDKCVAYANYCNQSQEGGNIMFLHANNDIISNCLSFRSDSHGIRFYNTTYGPALIKDCLSWGNKVNDIALKGIGLDQFGRAENSISLIGFDADHLENCIVGTANRYRRKANPSGPSNIVFAGQKTRWDREFADTENFDFRLQSDSTYRGKGPDGTDAGPFPYQPNIFYVRADGKDKKDGLSIKTAWATLERALKEVKPGDTIYLQGGSFELPATLTAGKSGEKPIFIRGRGKGLVSVTGRTQLKNCENIEFERIAFQDAVQAQGGKGLTFRNCQFLETSIVGLSADRVDQLTVEHSFFIGGKAPALELRATSGVFLTGNAFANQAAPAVAIDKTSAIKFSDYHTYSNTANCWKVGSTNLPLEKVAAEHDRYSRGAKLSVQTESGIATVENRLNLLASAQGGAPAGVALFYNENTLFATPPKVHSVSATTANIEWVVSRAATCVVAWGETPDCPNQLEIDSFTFGGASLTGLKPGQTYYFQMKSVDSPKIMKYSENIQSVKFSTEPISFTTLTEDTPARVYYVSPDGNDTHDGLQPTQPWRSLQHAANKVNVGDKVLVMDGAYSERVRIRATGTPEKPIRFAAANLNKAVIDGQFWLPGAFSLINKSHIALDGFNLVNINQAGSPSPWYMLNKSGAVNAYLSDGIEITRSFYDGRSRGYSPPFLNVWRCKNLAVENCLIMNLFNGMIISECPDMKIANNAFIRNKIRAANIFNDKTERCTLENNIFTDNLKNKRSQSLFEVSNSEPLIFKNNCFYLRDNDVNRLIMVVYDSAGTESKKVNMARYDAEVLQSNSIFANPDFPAAHLPGNEKGHEIDKLVNPEVGMSITDFVAQNPELIQRGIGIKASSFLK